MGHLGHGDGKGAVPTALWTPRALGNPSQLMVGENLFVRVFTKAELRVSVQFVEVTLYRNANSINERHPLMLGFIHLLPPPSFVKRKWGGV